MDHNTNQQPGRKAAEMDFREPTPRFLEVFLSADNLPHWKQLATEFLTENRGNRDYTLARLSVCIRAEIVDHTPDGLPRPYDDILKDALLDVDTYSIAKAVFHRACAGGVDDTDEPPEDDTGAPITPDALPDDDTDEATGTAPPDADSSTAAPSQDHTRRRRARFRGRRR